MFAALPRAPLPFPAGLAVEALMRAHGPTNLAERISWRSQSLRSLVRSVRKLAT